MDQQEITGGIEPVRRPEVENQDTTACIQKHFLHSFLEESMVIYPSNHIQGKEHELGP